MYSKANAWHFRSRDIVHGLVNHLKTKELQLEASLERNLEAQFNWKVNCITKIFLMETCWWQLLKFLRNSVMIPWPILGITIAKAGNHQRIASLKPFTGKNAIAIGYKVLASEKLKTLGFRGPRTGTFTLHSTPSMMWAKGNAQTRQVRRETISQTILQWI